LEKKIGKLGGGGGADMVTMKEGVLEGTGFMQMKESQKPTLESHNGSLSGPLDSGEDQWCTHVIKEGP
jgi:hypothetical protein